MWQNIKLNEASVNTSMKSFDNNKPRTRIPLSDEVLTEFEKYGAATKKNKILQVD